MTGDSIPYRALRERLDELLDAHPPATYLASDPLGIVRQRRPEERVIAAHIAAPLAYGAVDSIRRSASEILAALADVTSLSEQEFCYPSGALLSLLPSWRYRMTPIEAMDAYLSALSTLIAGHGSLEAAFSSGDNQRGDVREALAAYVAEIRAHMPSDSRATRYLTPDPRTGSACKRWFLMLRWLARLDDGVDLGLWSSIDPSRLVLPLDRHVASLARSLGLTTRRTVDYKMARAATDKLAQIDASDPLRYDMALCHLGISGRCEHRYEPLICPGCELRDLCAYVRADGRGPGA